MEVDGPAPGYQDLVKVCTLACATKGMGQKHAAVQSSIKLRSDTAASFDEFDEI